MKQSQSKFRAARERMEVVKLSPADSLFFEMAWKDLILTPATPHWRTWVGCLLVTLPKLPK